MAPRGADERVPVLNVNYPGRVSLHLDRAIYEAMKDAILRAVPPAEPGLRFKDLPAAVERIAEPGLFSDRSVSWYTTTVKLDLEARGLLRRSNGRGPQRLVRAG